MRFILLLTKRVGSAAILLLAACPLWAESGDASADIYVPGTIDSLSWRNIGPNRGGRSIAVSGNPNRPFEYYFGATGGGLWKTSDGGNTWRPVTDGQIRSSSVGAVAVAPSNPDVIYMGMGEVQLRGNVMQGDGAHKSVDGGRTWTHSGLPNSLAIGRIRIHPKNPDLAYAAVLGDPTGPNEDRGVYRTRDGGRTWDKVLYKSAKTGAVDLALDPNNPDVLYASLWQVYRNAYQLWSGGPESGLWKSSDGGETWTELTRNPGLPEGTIGKIGVAVSEADSKRLYAIIEADAGGLYRSDDAGATWTLVDNSRDLWQRAFYFNRVTAHPKEVDTVYVLNAQLLESNDGGKTWDSIRTPHGDYHDLWINPENPELMVCANDGGGTVTTNRGRSWTPQNFPTAQMYHVNTTRDFPYHVVGAQQDNSTAAVSSQPGAWWARPKGPAQGSFYAVGGGENAYVATHPENPNIFFAGATNTLTRFDRATGEERDVQPFPRMFMGESSDEVPERWNWVYPIMMTRNKHLYAASQQLWRSLDEGKTWDKISPDLTRADQETMGPSGGPIVLDQDGPEIYATIFAVAPSEVDADTIWVGSDDGLVHVTRNGGADWINVTPPDMVANTRVSLIEASPHDAATAFVAAKRNQMGDRAPHIWKTHDSGKIWKRIVNGIRADDFVHAIREDPQRAGLLYAGTEHGVYVSFDEGDHWKSLSLNLPDVQVPDLVVEGRDLVIATHGRSFYVLDDLSPLRQMARGQSRPAVHLFKPSDAVRRVYTANIDFYLESVTDPFRLEVLDGKGALVRELRVRGAGSRNQPSARQGRGRQRGGGSGVKAGLNRLRWDLRCPGATVFEGMILESSNPSNGPWAPPGQYVVKLTLGDQSWTQSLTVLKDPRLGQVTQQDLEEQFTLAMKVRDRVSAANEAVILIRKLKTQMDDDRITGEPELQKPLAELKNRLSLVEAQLYQVKNQSPKDKIAFPIQLNDRLAGLFALVQEADGAPNRAHYEVFEQLSSELDGHLAELDQLLENDLAAVNKRLSKKCLPLVTK